MGLLPEFQRALAVLHSSDAVVLGVSGGMDSLVMLHLFVHSREALGLQLHVLHLDHRIRGQEAEADARFVASICEQWGVPCRVEQADVPALAQQCRIALEEAARLARYTALGKEAARLGAAAIAVAHNADDQAETVLMHLLRGTGLAGLRGMLPVSRLSDYHLLEPITMPAGASAVSPLLIRPLLNIPRAEIAAYCTEQGLTPRFDRSNLDTTYFRNRLRHEIIPLLATVNPNLRAMLVRTASVVAADYEALTAQVDAAWLAVTLEESERRICFDRAKWQMLSLAMQRGTIRRAAWRLRASLRDVTYSAVEAAVKVGRSHATGAQATLPGGLTLRVDYDALVIASPEEHLPAPDWPLLEPGSAIRVEKPGETVLPGSGWRFSLRPYDGPRAGVTWKAIIADPWTAPLRIEASRELPLCLRTRRPGDRFRPQGVGGTQKVAEFMVNEKIPLAWRDRIPLFVIGDEIAWVCGWRVDEWFVAAPAAEKVWLAQFEGNP